MRVIEYTLDNVKKFVIYRVEIRYRVSLITIQKNIILQNYIAQKNDSLIDDDGFDDLV